MYDIVYRGTESALCMAAVRTDPPTSPSSASVLWSFGHGLSYDATFVYSGLKLSTQSEGSQDVPSVGLHGTVTVSFTVMNTGTRAAEEVAQLYVRDDISSGERS
jgi:beta-glucosidase